MGLPSMPNFVKKNIERDFFFGAIFLPRIRIFTIVSYLSPLFHTYNIEILLKIRELGSINDTKEPLKGFYTWPAGMALPRR